MAYSDLYADADLYFSFNNTDTYTTTSTLKSQQNPTSQWVFTADGPAGTGTDYCVKANNYSANSMYYQFYDFPAGTDYGRSFSTWVKIVPQVPLTSGTTSLGSSLIFFINDPSSGASDDDRFQLNLGTYNNTVTGGADRYLQLYSWEVTVSTSTASRVSSFTPKKIPLNEWVHIAYVIKEHPDNDIIEKVIYVNGVAYFYLQSTNKGYMNGQWETATPVLGGVSAPQFTLSGTNTSNAIVYQSHTGFWNRALTKAEIRNQAWYAHQNEDYNTLILSDNPTVLMDFDNTNKAVAHSVYGEAWEPFTASDAYNIDQNAFANKKGWTNVINVNNGTLNRLRNTGTNIRTRVGQLIRSGEYSVEFWFKITDKPTSSRPFITMDPTSTLLKNGFNEFGMSSTGQPYVSQAYKSGTTSYLSGSLSSTTIPNVAAGQEMLILHPGGTNAKNYADNEWHHFVYTLSITDGLNWSGTAGTYNGAMYIDGARTMTRQFTNTYGWLDGVDPIQFFEIGYNTTISTLRDSSVAAFAWYPRRLSEKEIEEHFVAGKDYISEQGAVKYYDGSTWQLATAAKTWDGSSWIDWSKKYYDGTQWVTI